MKLLPHRYESLSESKEFCMMKDKCNLWREGLANHDKILKALSRALNDIEEAYLNMADQASNDNLRLELMGSCILVALVKDKDEYSLNVNYN